MIHSLSVLEHLIRTTRLDEYRARYFLDKCAFHWHCDWETFKRVIAPSITDDEIRVYTRDLQALSEHEIRSAWDACVRAYRPALPAAPARPGTRTYIADNLCRRRAP